MGDRKQTSIEKWGEQTKHLSSDKRGYFSDLREDWLWTLCTLALSRNKRTADKETAMEVHYQQRLC